MKYYVKVQTECGDMVLTIRESNEEKAKNKLYKDYNFDQIIEFSDKPIQSKLGVFAKSSLYAMSINHYASASKRYNSWG